MTRGRRRTRAADQEAVVLGAVGGVDFVDDVVAVEGEGDVLSDPCERRGQELLEYAGVVAVDGLDGGDDVVADEEGESHGGG
jgi:hypothetical protein